MEAYAFDLGDGFAVNASKILGHQTLRMNHSAAKPNVWAVVLNVRWVRRVGMYAICDVKIDSELLFDYGDQYDWKGQLVEAMDTEMGCSAGENIANFSERVAFLLRTVVSLRGAQRCEAVADGTPTRYMSWADVHVDHAPELPVTVELACEEASGGSHAVFG
jgi:hypothetical protein